MPDGTVSRRRLAVVALGGTAIALALELGARESNALSAEHTLLLAGVLALTVLLVAVGQRAT
jgi:hypothetical protein